MLPELQMDFVDDLPYCRTFEKCVATASPILATSTVLVVPRASPFGNAYDRAAEPCPELKGSIGEGSNHSNFSDRSSVRILGIERKPRKTTSSK